ncbi:MAG: hypothetical protein HZA54_00625 [Planctomycetes bacterium]|nr:hypothetical protein [Planctomycetota bacterium]
MATPNPTPPPARPAITFRDFSHDVHAALGTPGGAPTVRGGKFVVVAHAADLHIACGPREVCAYHADVVERLARALGLVYSRAGAGQRCVIDSPAWEVLGGGHWQLDDQAMTLELSGASQAYGRYPRAVADALAALPEFAGWRISAV